MLILLFAIAGLYPRLMLERARGTMFAGVVVSLVMGAAVQGCAWEAGSWDFMPWVLLVAAGVGAWMCA